MTVPLFVYPTRSMARRIDASLQILKELHVSEQIPNYMAYILYLVKQKVEIPIIPVLRNKLSTVLYMQTKIPHAGLAYMLLF